ncbi:cytochrome P460 family protein [Spirosoma spitsbergense]|uniref:cytochrome P460 family protein n=1 Tax=Spirosoma spitsbergense TaxID=431554 RepID=UPI00035C4C58|nr:cytochrome P460 family protein [Spirosoma spitsbergense]
MKLTAALLSTILLLAGKYTPVPPSPQYGAGEVDSIYSIKIPAGFRDWRLISVAHEEGTLNDLRAILGNDIAIEAYRNGTRPFPDGAIIARLSWDYVSSDENNKVFGRRQSFVAGHPKNNQFIVKDSKEYALSGGWGFAQFNEGESVNVAVHATCFPCHQAVQSRDFVFTQYAR